jgi:hypothetical protein
MPAGAWPAVAGVSGVAVVVGGCGAVFPAVAGLALAGNVLLVLMVPSLVPQVARFVRIFPAPGASGPSSESRVVDRPRGVRGGHRCLDRRPKSAPVDVQCSVIPATTA